MRRRQAIGMAGAGAALLACPALARAGPGAVSIIVADFPSAPAGIAARLLRAALAAALGRDVIVDFRPGAGGIVGLMAGARARADGAVLTMLGPAIAAAPWLAARMDNTPADFAPIGRISFTPEVLVVAASSPWHDLSDLLAALRADPGRVPTAFDGVWSSAEITEVLMLDRAGLAARPMPGLRAGQGLADGRIAFAMRPLPWALARIGAGELRALAVSSPGPVASLPKVPNFRARGIDVALGSWLVLAAPAGAGDAALVPAREALRRVMGRASVRAALSEAGVPPSWEGATATARAMETEYRLLGRIFTEAGVNVRHAAMAAR